MATLGTAVTAFIATLAVLSAAAGSASAAVPVTYTSTTRISLVADGVTFTCTSALGSGVAAAPPSTAAPSGTLDAMTFSTCTGPLPVSVTLLPTWNLAPGSLTNVGLRVTSVAPGFCDFDATGTLTSSYDLGTQSLAFTGGSLTVSGAPTSTCFGLILDGDPATLDATFTVT